VTGEQVSISAAVAPLVARMREVTHLPLAVGFGISNPVHVEQVGQLADGVVVGSAIVKFIESHAASTKLVTELEGFVRTLSAPLRS
jgi:tryptophan synthase alpha chain